MTVATLQSRLDASEKQVIQLQKALERNDQYTEQLETELKMLKLRVATNQANYPDQERGDPDGLIVGSSIINDTESSSGLTNCVQYSLFADGANKPEGDGITAPSAKLHHLQLVTPAGNSQFFARSDTPSIDIDDNSVPSSSSLNIDSLMDEFVAPARSPSHDAKVSFSRRLQFDDNMLQDENTVSSSYEFESKLLAIATSASTLSEELIFLASNADFDLFAHNYQAPLHVRRGFLLVSLIHGCLVLLHHPIRFLRLSTSS